MASTSPIDQARNFVRLILEDEVPTLELLARRLDELVMAYHTSPSGKLSEAEPEPRREGPNENHPRIAQRFPDLGSYWVADPAEAHERQPYRGDAINDLADIVRDLEEVLWRLDRVGLDDAHYEFRQGFEIHWGRHARELALYLHSRRFG